MEIDYGLYDLDYRKTGHISEFRKRKIEELDALRVKALKNMNRKGIEKSIPERFKDLTLDKLKSKKANEEVTQMTINKFNEIEENPYGLFYYGSVGTGKTTQLVTIAQELQNKKGYKVYYWTEKRFLSDLKKTFGIKSKTEFEVIDNIIKNYDVICIDELGQDISPWAKEWIKVLLEEIYDNKKILFCTSNYSLKELLQNYNEELKSINDITSQQIIDRLSVLTRAIFLEGSSLRIKQ